MPGLDTHSLKEDVLNILRLIYSNDSVTQRDLSSSLTLSLGKVNYLLKELMKKDMIKIKEFASKSQKIRRVKYVLTKKGFKEKLALTLYFLKKKEREYLELKRESQSLLENREEISVDS